jgi:hypothetical protein
MNSMQKYDVALMEGVSQKRLSKKRMRAFIEAVSEIAPPSLVEAVVTAHNALFEYNRGVTHRGVRYVSGVGASDFRKTNDWGDQTIYNGNDLVATGSRYKPPTSGGTDWHKQSNTGTAAMKHYDNVHTYRTQRMNPSDYPNYNYSLRGDESWYNQNFRSAPTHSAPPPPELPAPQAVRQQAPQPAPKPEPPKQECPPVCPVPDTNADKPTVEPKAPEPKKEAPKKEAPKKAAAQYSWKDKDFLPIEKTPNPGHSCNTEYRYVINLVSFNKENDGAAAKEARFLATHNVAGVYTYQYDGLAQNTTRPDVWRVRIGYFKSKAAARTYFRPHVHKLVGDQFRWWVGTCDGPKGDNMKPGTFKLGGNISDSDCVDGSVAQKSSAQPAANTQTQQAQQKTEHKSIMDYAKGK